MIRQILKESSSRVRIWLCLGLIIAFLGISGCGCLMPDVPCVPGARQSRCLWIAK